MPLFRRKWLIACEMDLQNHPVFAPKDRRIPFGGRRRRKSGETLRTLRRWKKPNIAKAKRMPGTPPYAGANPAKCAAPGFTGF